MSTVFPAAPTADRGHPAYCACPACVDSMAEAIRRPLVEPASRRDPALDRRGRR